jgi:kojibiose phosphorylase
MLFETARFWASRVEYDTAQRAYVIRNVIGPDEFHTNVDNNAFTNFMARWNLLIAHRMAQFMKTRFPGEFERLCQRLNLKAAEIQAWMHIAPRIRFRQRKDGVIEQFDGYWKLRQVPLKGRNAHGLPAVPQRFNWKQVHKTQLLKQADVVMLLDLFHDLFEPKTKAQNYAYYEPRTVHQSSLSPGMYALAAADVGQLEAAYRFFRLAVALDLENIAGNTAEGMHAASLGGVWQAVVHGFGGVRPARNTLQIRPQLPKSWKSLSFSFWWHGARLEIVIDHEKVRISAPGPQKHGTIHIKVYGRLRELHPDKTLVCHKSTPARQPRKRSEQPVVPTRRTITAADGSAS